MQARGTDSCARAGKAQDPDPQNGQRGVENERNEKIPVEQKAGDPLGERTIASPLLAPAF
jgi:hypothetical protein